MPFLPKIGLLSTSKRVARGFGRSHMAGTSHCNKTQNYGKNLHQHLCFNTSAPLSARNAPIVCSSSTIPGGRKIPSNNFDSSNNSCGTCICTYRNPIIQCQMYQFQMHQCYQPDVPELLPAVIKVVWPSAGALADIAPNTVTHMESLLIHQAINRVTPKPEPNKK
jgi:hypothetical protein